MAKKTTPTVAASSKSAVKSTVPPDAVSTPVRNSAIPPKSTGTAAPAKKAAPTHDAIAIRAYTIWQSTGGNERDNWIRAERELSGL